MSRGGGRRVHVIGAGLAGLSAAVALAGAGRPVVVYEAGPQAGGRCRSYFDRALGCVVDNGNHLLLSGNRAALGYVRTIGARDTIGGPGAPFFPFLDRHSGARWVVRPSRGPLPWWVLSARRRVPGTRPRDYLRLLALRRPPAGMTVAEAAPPGLLTERLLEPLAVAALNTPLKTGLASLLGAVMRETLLVGGGACIPCLPRSSLAASLVDPAVAWLAARGAEVRLGQRVAALGVEGGRVASLALAGGSVPVGPDEAVVLAVPPWVAADALPGLDVPTAFEAIVNVHFRATDEITAATPADFARARFIGLIGGVAEWVFLKPGHVSVTISAANRVVDEPAEMLARAVWPDVRAALGCPEAAIPPWRVVKEKRATFAATAAQERLRPPTRTALANLALAGDWTATGLPATIEGAIRSGQAAAAHVATVGSSLVPA